jgi:hypothetical protein
MTNTVETATNTINVVTQSHLSVTPQAVAYSFKEWMGVISMIGTSIYTAFHLVFPKVQAFMDTRDGGWVNHSFVWMFGTPKVEAKVGLTVPAIPANTQVTEQPPKI